MPKKITTDEYINKAKYIHSEKYDYSLINYTNNSNKIRIICSIHGEFSQIPYVHLNGSGCPNCAFNKVHKGNLSNNSKFINKANKIHKNKYDYSFTKYLTAKDKIKIICPLHGEFDQTPHAHLKGHGCKLCANIITQKSAILNSRGWSLNDWVSNCNNSNARLYIINCYNDNERFIKIGITKRTINVRFDSKQEMPYNYNILYDIESTPEKIFLTEISIKKQLKKFSYTPLIKFNGATECYTENIIYDIKNFIKIN